MIYTAVFILSISSLAFEILLTRIFSISQWNHLAFMVISIALLGFAASGIFLNILSSRTLAWESRFSLPIPLSTLLLLYSLSQLGAFYILNVLPLDYFMLPVAPFQAVYIFIAYGVLAFPFFICGLVFSIGYGALPEKTGYVYAVNMMGSAVGAILPLLFLRCISESTLILLFGLLPLVTIPPFFVFSLKNNPVSFFKAKPWNAVFIFCIIGIGVILSFGLSRKLFDTHPSEYKALSQLLKFPDTHVQHTCHTLRGRLDAVASKFIRYAPGLSIKYMNQLPEQQAIYVDGDMPLVLYKPEKDLSFLFADYTLDKIGYRLSPTLSSVLVVVKSGGLSIPCALSSHPTDITVLHENPKIAETIGSFYHVDTVGKGARSFLASQSKMYDIIHIDNRGASLPGASALDQDYSFTLDSFKNYLGHLSTNGHIIITRRLILPPSDMIRLAATAYESLRSIGVRNPENHLAIIRNWENYVLIVGKNPIAQPRLLHSVSADLNFDMVYVPGLSPAAANTYNIFDRPYYYEAIDHLFLAYQNKAESAYFKTHLLMVHPQTDNCPFPYKFLKWTQLIPSFHATGSRPYSLFLSGEILVLVVLAEAIVISVLFLIIPLGFVSNWKKADFFQPEFWYFFFVGAGFMLIEMYFIKLFLLLFDSPVITFSIVLASILITSGLGGAVSQHIRWEKIHHLFFMLLFCILLCYMAVPTFLLQTVGDIDKFRIFSAVLIMTPVGILMGFPFSMGMRYLAPGARKKAYAWAANGCASVLTAILAVHLALNIGIQAIIVSAVGAYCMAYFSMALKPIQIPVIKAKTSD